MSSEKSLDKKPFYQIGKTYSISLNPNNLLQIVTAHYANKFFGKPKAIQCMDQIANKINELMPMSSKDIEYILYPDISEPRTVIKNFPRFHYHGIIKFKTRQGILNWLLKYQKEVAPHSTIDIDTINDMNKWLNYCKKYIHIIPKKYILSNYKSQTELAAL